MRKVFGELTETEMDTLFTSKEKAFYLLCEEADKAGKKAADEKQVVPMVVNQHENMLDDSSPVKKSWLVDQGVCGFAWINVRDGRKPFSRFLKKFGYGRTDSYYGGITIWVGDYGQSLQLKEAYAYAFNSVLHEANIDSYASSRMD